MESITLVINNPTPAMEAAVLALLDQAESGSISVAGAPQGVRPSPSRKLDDVWLSEGVVYETADASGITRNLATRAVHSFARAVMTVQKGSGPTSEVRRATLLPPEFAQARVTPEFVLNAQDFVVLVGSVEARNRLREHTSSYGARAEEASILLAEHLKSQYPQG